MILLGRLCWPLCQWSQGHGTPSYSCWMTDDLSILSSKISRIGSPRPCLMKQFSIPTIVRDWRTYSHSKAATDILEIRQRVPELLHIYYEYLWEQFIKGRQIRCASELLRVSTLDFSRYCLFYLINCSVIYHSNWNSPIYVSGISLRRATIELRSFSWRSRPSSVTLSTPCV
jgi:hypothetical protein